MLVQSGHVICTHLRKNTENCTLEDLTGTGDWRGPGHLLDQVIKYLNNNETILKSDYFV